MMTNPPNSKKKPLEPLKWKLYLPVTKIKKDGTRLLEIKKQKVAWLRKPNAAAGKTPILLKYPNGLPSKSDTPLENRIRERYRKESEGLRECFQLTKEMGTQTNNSMTSWTIKHAMRLARWQP